MPVYQCVHHVIAQKPYTCPVTADSPAQAAIGFGFRAYGRGPENTLERGAVEVRDMVTQQVLKTYTTWAELRADRPFD